MSAPIEVPEHYLVNHGKSGGLGSFPVQEPLLLARGERVVLETARGLEMGDVRCPASVTQSRLLAAGSGRILRRARRADEAALRNAEVLADRAFDVGRQLARTSGWSVEILDVEVLLDGRRGVVQFLSKSDGGLDEFAVALGAACSLDITLENLALPQAPDESSNEHGGCGKPDCGRGAGGSCSTCSSGGGCSSCGSAKFDVRDYFAHLRTRMEAAHRTPLL